MINGPITSPDDWLDQYYSGEYFSGNFNHLKEYLIELELEFPKSKIITVAGTNGKGQTIRLLAEMLKSKGFSYTLWTSPHLKVVNERFETETGFIESDVLLKNFDYLKNYLEKNEKMLSYFEFLFISFLMLSKVNQPDFILLEVGLGGRLDATNILDCDIAVVTSISRDHQELLGNSYKKILFEKMAIARSGGSLITNFELEYLRKLALGYSLSQNINSIDLFADGVVLKKDNYSVRNEKLARYLFQSLTGESFTGEIDHKKFALRKTIKKELIEFDLFPSHNVDGLRKLIQFLQDAKYTNYDYLIVSFSKRDLNDIKSMCRILGKSFGPEKIFLQPFEHMKALLKEDIFKLKEEFKFNIIDDSSSKKILISNQKESSESTKSKRVLVTGSNYFLGDFIKSWDKPSC